MTKKWWFWLLVGWLISVVLSPHILLGAFGKKKSS